ncbi:MAG: TonB-dependent receptor [Flammeovirgaceae bacterium]|nr:TonB-dependent receptor [Flammeovirgaceae bacterium]
MKVILLAIATLVIGLPGFSQIQINGVVKDNNGEVLPGANIFIDGTYDGASSDVEGKFSFKTSEQGVKTLVVKVIGFKEYKQQISLSKNINLSVQLQEEINQLEAVTISAGSFTASDEARRTVFKAVDIATTAGATADIAGALNTLPGTQKVGESGRLFVRGGDGNEAKTFIDGILVLDAYSPSAPNTPSRGRFLPFMFKGTSFSTGGYSAEYGQALSSALVLDSKDQETLTRTDIGIMSVGADVAHTQAWARGSLAGKIQYTNIRPYFGLINQEIDWRTPPAAIEGSSAFRHEVGKTGMVKFYGNFNHSDFSIYNHDIDDYSIRQLYDLTNDYRYVNGFYKTELNKNWSLRGGGSYTLLKNQVALDDINMVEEERGIHSKGVIEGSLANGIELKTGVEIIDRDYRASIDTTTQSLTFHELISASFAEIDIYASNRFVTRAGVRLEHHSLRNEFYLDPRISLAYKPGSAGQFSLAYGKFRQSVKNEYLRWNDQLKQEQADHYILNYQLIENNRTFRAELYYKKYNNLVRIQDNEVTNTGHGYAKGFELFWRDNKTFRKVDYWISYSFLDTKRTYLDFPSSTTPSFASKHNFSAVYKHFISDLKSQLGFTYSWTSGRPYNNPNEVGFMTARTPAYHDFKFQLELPA